MLEELEKAIAERDLAVAMLAEWVVAVTLNGTEWYCWEEPYKNASYRPCDIRGLLDEAILREEVTWKAF